MFGGAHKLEGSVYPLAKQSANKTTTTNPSMIVYH